MVKIPFVLVQKKSQNSKLYTEGFEWLQLGNQELKGARITKTNKDNFD
jgi:hypothetical protein